MTTIGEERYRQMILARAAEQNRALDRIATALEQIAATLERGVQEVQHD